MLPSDLLVARRYRDTIRPAYAKLTEENLGYARRLLGLFETHLGRRRELEEAIRTLEEESGRDYRYVRGLATLLERRCQFKVEATVTPAEARERIFHATAHKGIPTTLEERRRLLEEEAVQLDVSAEEFEDSLYADLEEEQVLYEFQPIDAEDLVRLYNLGLTQTLLFKCTEMEFTASGNWQQIFRWIKWLGLIYTIQQQEEGYRVRVDGPVSLFKLGTRYGTSLAKLLPRIVAAPEWGVQAWILRRRGNHQLLKLELDSFRHARYLKAVELPTREVYDSMVEESFAERFNTLRTGWRLTREPDALPVSRNVMIPDFLFEKAGMRVYMEVAGFWTPEYLRHKLKQLQEVEGVDMIVAADRAHACHQLDRLGKKLNIIYYKGKVPIRPILDHLRTRETELRHRQLEQLRELELKPEGPVVTAVELAQRLGVLEEAVKEELRHRDIPGYRLLGDVLISDSTLEEIARHLDERMGEGIIALNEAVSLVEELGGARPSRILEHLGYSIEWHGINPEKAEVHRKQATRP
jgi:predicted nuclease of restriction endonuclease-like RecB superfamily